MAIHTLAPPTNINGAAIDTLTKPIAPTRPNEVSASALDSGGLATPATTAQLSMGGLIMRLLQVYEAQHPDQAQAFLQGIADKLHADAPHAGAFATNLNAWGDAFQRAADTGDLSNLLPSAPPAAHFGIRAYQVARQPPEDASAIAALLRNSLTPLANDANVGNLEAVTSQLLDTVSESLRALSTLTAPGIPATLNDPNESLRVLTTLTAPNTATANNNPSDGTPALNTLTAPNIAVANNNPSDGAHELNMLTAPNIAVTNNSPNDGAPELNMLTAPNIAVTNNNPSDGAPELNTLIAPNIAVTNNNPSESTLALNTLTAPNIASANNNPIDDATLAQNALRMLNANEAAGPPLQADQLDPMLAEVSTPVTTPLTSALDATLASGPDAALNDIANAAVASAAANTPNDNDSRTLLHPSAVSALRTTPARDASVVASRVAVNNLAVLEALGVDNIFVPPPVPVVLAPVYANYG